LVIRSIEDRPGVWGKGGTISTSNFNEFVPIRNGSLTHKMHQSKNYWLALAVSGRIPPIFPKTAPAAAHEKGTSPLFWAAMVDSSPMISEVD